MSYLLDTHVLLWAISERKKLSAPVRAVLDDTNNTIFVSSISFWEIALKFSISKLTITGVLPDEIPELSLEMGFQLIPLSPDESASYYKLTVTAHKDMFDRMLIWQAIERNLIFISKDDSIAQYRSMGLKTLW
jgi:PIN domain nuclease of toxin-antitoxin system